MFQWMFENSLVVLALSAVAIPVCMLLRSRPAVCHVLWLVILVRLVLPPVPVDSPQSVRGFVHTATDRLTSLVDEGIAVVGTAAPVLLRSVDGDQDPTRVKPLGAGRGPEEVSAVQEPSSALASLRALGRLATTDGVRISALTLWMLGGLGLLVVQLRRCRDLAQLVDKAPEADAPLRRTVAYMANVLDVDVPSVRLLEGLGSPVVWSLGRPVFLWPSTGARATSSGCIKGIVAHELAHVRRRDHWVAWFELAAMAVCWWNPVFWFVRRRLRLHAEEACDAWAVWALPGSRRAYAEALIDVAEQRTRPISRAPILGVSESEPRDFRKRLSLIMEAHVSHRASPIAAGLAIAVAVALLPGDAGRPPAEPATLLVAEAPATRPTPEVTVTIGIPERLLPAIEAEQRVWSADALFRNAQWAEAAALYRQIVENSPDNGWALHKLGRALLEQGRDVEALQVFEHQLATGIRRADALMDIAAIHAARGDHEMALAGLTVAVEEGFDDLDRFATDPRLEGLRASGRLTEVEATARHAAALMARGDLAIENEHWADAVATFRAARQLCPRMDRATHLLAYSLFGVGAHEEALQICTEQVERGFAVATALYNSACARARLGLLDEAMDALESSLEHGFDRWSMLSQDADLEALRETPRMKTLLAEVDRRYALRTAAECARESGDWDAAVEHWSALVEVAPPAGKERLLLAESFLKSGEPSAAATVLEDYVLHARKGMHEALFQLARTHAMTGENSSALAYLERAVKTGFADSERMRTDELLAGLRVTHRYGTMLQIVEARDRAEHRPGIESEA